MSESNGLLSGIDLQCIDRRVRPQDDFYRHVNGRWLEHTEIPPDRGRYGSFDQLADDSLAQLHALIGELGEAGAAPDPGRRKIVDLFASFMDEQRLERLGLQPLDVEWARIGRLRRRSGIPALIGHLNRLGVSTPYQPQVHQDAGDATRYAFDLAQGGLGMPDRDYYLEAEPRLRRVRECYGEHIARMLHLAGVQDAQREAQRILALETALAQAQWSRVQNRDPVQTYNRLELAQLEALTPGYGWRSYLRAAGVAGRLPYLIVSQPSYLAAFGQLVQRTPLGVWRSYFRWLLLHAFAPFLSRAFVEEDFAFHGTALRGIAAIRPRWKRGVGLVDGALGEELGRVYVARHFPPQSKARMDALVGNLISAYRIEIDSLEWMGPETRRRAQEKLARFGSKIGYPARWRDYGSLAIADDDLAGNVMRTNAFDYERNVGKLGRPIDRDEWHMTPQTVNAYYNPEMNEIVFPAAILQPPFFNAASDDAVNYGGIGAVIGHEISHGFDDQGSQYDGGGNLLTPPGWFTPQDLERFKARTRALVQQYAGYAPVPGFPDNGELTLRENIADNSGLAIAYKAYRLSLGSAAAPMIDGLSGDQRFFMGWAQVWSAKSRDDEAILRIKSDPHAPAQFRGTVPQMNQASFHEAFGVGAGDRMYLPPAQRVRLW